jgi:hypothetical protein
MTAYRNTTKGARAIHLTNGGHVLVEPGATAEVKDSSIKRIAPGIVKDEGDAVSEPPAELVEKVKAKSAEADAAADENAELTALREEYRAKVGKQAFNGWDAAKLREKIGAA